MNNLKKAGLLLSIPFTLFAIGCNGNESKLSIKTTIKEVTDPTFGNIAFDLKQEDFERLGFHYDDLMNITIHDYNGTGKDLTFEVAFVKNYNETGYFAPCLCNYGGKMESPEISFGIMPQKDAPENLVGKEVTIEMKKKQGYHKTRELIDVATKLTYEELGKDNLAYANFRDVTSVGTISKYIMANRVFRGSSPFNAKGNPDERDYIADAYLDVYQIESEVSLANTDEEIEKLMDEVAKKGRNSYTLSLYEDSLQYTAPEDYPKKSFFAVNLGSDYFTMTNPDKDGDNARKVFEYFSNRCNYLEGNNHSFYFHCNEGKDRTGFFAMVLEALAGCTLDDLVADAMLTFKNYYNVSVVNNKDKYDALANLLIYRQIYSILLDDPVDELPKINWYEFNAKEAVEEKVGSYGHVLSVAAYRYLRRIDVGDEDIAKIQRWLTSPVN